MGEVPEDAHRAFARVADVGHGAGVEVRRRSEVAVGLLGLADEEVDGIAEAGVVDVALAGR